MKKVKTIKLDIYNRSVNVCLVDDSKALNKIWLDRMGYESDGDIDGLTLKEDDGNYSIVFSEEDLDVGVLAHEVFHVTCNVAEDICATIDPANDEPFAYLNEYIFKQSYKALKHLL